MSMKGLTPYNCDVTILPDRGFKSVNLFKFIDEILQWKYCIIRSTKDLGISIVGKNKIKKLSDIIPTRWSIKYFYNIKLTAQDDEDIWFIANNLSRTKFFNSLT